MQKKMESKSESETISLERQPSEETIYGNTIIIVTSILFKLGLLSLILKSLIKSLMPKAPVGASIRLLHSKGCC